MKQKPPADLSFQRRRLSAPPSRHSSYRGRARIRPLESYYFRGFQGPFASPGVIGSRGRSWICGQRVWTIGRYSIEIDQILPADDLWRGRNPTGNEITALRPGGLTGVESQLQKKLDDFYRKSTDQGERTGGEVHFESYNKAGLCPEKIC